MINLFSKHHNPLSFSQRFAIIDRLEEIAAFYSLLKNEDVSLLYKTVTSEIKTSSRLTRYGLVGIKGITPTILHEINLVLKKKPSLTIENLMDREDVLDLKRNIYKIKKYL